MIIDTTYILPLARIEIDTDLLKAILEDKTKNNITLDELKISLISIFELQAKASKINIPAKDIVKAINIILKSFRIIPFYQKDIVEEAYKLRKILHDYIDCIILATAITHKEDLITEDSLIHGIKEKIERKYGIKIIRYSDLV